MGSVWRDRWYRLGPRGQLADRWAGPAFVASQQPLDQSVRRAPFFFLVSMASSNGTDDSARPWLYNFGRGDLQAWYDASAVASRHGVAPTNCSRGAACNASRADSDWQRRRCRAPVGLSSFPEPSSRASAVARRKPRSSKRRSSTLPNSENSCGCRHRCRRTVPDEDRGR
jgi:hypothetical protein